MLSDIQLLTNYGTANPNFIYAILRQHKRFEALRNFTLEQGQEELDRENRLRKDRGEGIEGSPKVSFSMSEMQRPRRVPETPTTPTSPGAFEIGDDSDEEDDEPNPEKKSEEAPTSPIVTSPIVASPTTMSRPESASESAEDAVPLQLRGMSEKARGKLPEGAFQRQGSTTSLAGHVSGAATPTAGFGFVPTHAWVFTPSSIDFFTSS